MKAKRIIFVATAAVFLILGALGLRGKFDAKPVMASSHEAQVVIIDCGYLNAEFYAGEAFNIQGSPGTTPPSVGTPCSTALAATLSEGFTINTAINLFDTGLIEYTLARAH